jgi:hypothetical protein
MRADLHIGDAVVVTSLVLLALLMGAPVAGAADQPMGSGTQSQEGIGTQTMKDQPQIQGEIQVRGELGKGQERQMKVPEWLKIPPQDDYSHLLNLDFHGQDEGIVGRTKEEDEKHAVSF